MMDFNAAAGLFIILVCCVWIVMIVREMWDRRL